MVDTELLFQHVASEYRHRIEVADDGAHIRTLAPFGPDVGNATPVNGVAVFDGVHEIQHRLFPFAETYVVEAVRGECGLGHERGMEPAGNDRDVHLRRDGAHHLPSAQPLPGCEREADDVGRFAADGADDIRQLPIHRHSQELRFVPALANEGCDKRRADRGELPGAGGLDFEEEELHP